MNGGVSTYCVDVKGKVFRLVLVNLAAALFPDAN